MKIITIANQKGGTGKTTTAINLAAALARAEKNLLLVDFDPQGNLSTFLGFAPAPGAYNLLAAYIASLATLMRGDHGEQIRAFVRPSGREYLALLPGSAETATAQAFMLSGERDLNLIRRALTEQFSRYDLVILDTAPPWAASWKWPCGPLMRSWFQWPVKPPELKARARPSPRSRRSPLVAGMDT